MVLQGNIMADKQYNHELCQERHELIPKELEKVWLKIKQLENRFLIIVTMLVANLVGVLGVLLIK